MSTHSNGDPSCHAHHHHASVDNLKIAFLLNLAFTILEFVGGGLTNSISIMTAATAFPWAWPGISNAFPEKAPARPLPMAIGVFPTWGR